MYVCMDVYMYDMNIHTLVWIHVCLYAHLNLRTGWRRPIGCLIYVCHFPQKSPIGWRRLIGSPKLLITFHERAIKYRSILRKTTCKDKGSYESSSPCIMSRSFAKNDLQLKAFYGSLPPCTYTHTYL